LVNRDKYSASAIPGVVSVYPNHYVTSLKEPPWPQVLALMGKDGQRAMIDLILDCGIYVPTIGGHGNYYQLSGAFSAFCQ
jgi:telomerase reverse transcriptase